MLLYEMKGVATTVLIGHSATRGRLELARFADGSWAIRHGGPTTIGVWEPDEWAECFRVFAMLAGQRVPAGLRADATTTTAARGEDAATDGSWNWVKGRGAAHSWGTPVRDMQRSHRSCHS